MSEYILTLDQGTTSSRAIIFDIYGKVMAKSQKEFSLKYPRPGWVERDAQVLWDTQREVMDDVMKTEFASGVKAIAITNQRETTVLWSKKTGKPLYPAIIWQCRRTADICDRMKSDNMESLIKKRTGLVIDAYFSATKIKWIFENNPDIKEMARKGEVCFGTVDSWILWNLTEGKVHSTDYTNASRTMLFDIHRLKWDDEIAGILDIPLSVLPDVRDTSGIFGYYKKANRRIPVTAIAGDQQASLFGNTCFCPGDIKNTYGTGCFILSNTGDKAVNSSHGLLTTIGWKYKNNIVYALEGSVFNAGSAIQWLRDEIGIIKNSSECDILAEKVNDNNGTYFVPAFTGLGAPYWDMYARGTITGITRGTKKEHLARAVLESIAHQTQDVLEAMQKDSGIRFKSVYADGGASASRFLMQFQADISGIPVKCPGESESTALGAAYFAGLSSGIWKNTDELKAIHNIKNTYKPSMNKEKVMLFRGGWKRSVECSKDPLRQT